MKIQKPQLGLRGRLLLLVVLAIAPTCGLIAFSAWEDRAAADALAQRQTRQVALIVAAEHNRLIEQARQLLATLGSLPVVRDPALLPRCAEAMTLIRQQNPMYNYLGVVDSVGTMLCSTVPFQPGFNIADRSWFTRALTNRDFAVGDYIIGRLTGIPALPLSLPVMDADGQVQRVVVVAVDLPWLQTLAAKLPLPPGTAVAVVDAEGTILARHPDPQGVWTGKPTPEKAQVAAMLGQDCLGFAEFRGSALALTETDPPVLTEI